MADYDIVIAGAGHAGAHAAIALRQAGFTGTVAVIGMESHLPYDRPALSKDYLAGLKTFERLLLRPEAFWQDRKITFHLGQEVESVDPEAHRLKTREGMAIGYGKLIWAAGANPRKISCSGAELDGVYTIRGRDDIDRMLVGMDGINHITVIGGGYIGLEAAAVMRKLGKQVTLLEAQERLLARVAGPRLSEFYAQAHRAEGVDLRLGVTVTKLLGENDQVAGVELADGSSVRTDMVVVGIGIIPAAEPLTKAGVAGSNGIAVDDYYRTNLPDIFAIGDCAQHRNPYACGSLIRLESVHHANESASIAAQAIMGQPMPARTVPWFWSNQYDLRLQTVGLSQDHDEEIVRGDVTGRSFAIIYRRNGIVLALDCVNSSRDFIQGKELILKSTDVPADALADASIPLKSLIPKLAATAD